jgi:origin recognition complex subunit 1
VNQLRIHQNEIYFSLDSTSVVDTSAILSHCDVSSISIENQKPTSSRYKPPISSTENIFICVNAVDPRRGLYYELDWLAHRERSLKRAKEDDVEWGSSAPWVVVVELILKKPRTRTSEQVKKDADMESETSSDEEYRDESDSVDTHTHLLPSDADSAGVPQTPSKKRKRPGSAVSTPRRKRVGPVLAAPTPHSKRALRARARRPALRAPPPEMGGAFSLGEAPTETDPWLRAMLALHVGSRPEALPCRAEEYARVMRAVEELIEEGSGGCICTYYLYVNDQIIT